MRRHRLLSALSLLALAAAGCVAASPSTTPRANAGAVTNDPPANPPLQAPGLLENQSSAPHTVEVTLAAGTKHLVQPDGRAYDALVYNDLYPGPVLALTEGDHVIVHLRNNLAEPTNMHWHGLHVPASQDQAMEVVPPSGTRDYTFDVPAGGAGTYWYHPHLHGQVAHQVDAGLFGAVRVLPAADPLPAAYGDDLVVLSDPLAGAPVTDADRANGRQGPVVLANGQQSPTLTLHPGEVRRLRLVNASPSRYERIAVPGGKLVLVGTDGGAIDRPVALPELLLAPAERAEILISATTRTSLQALPYDRGMMAAGMSHGGTAGGGMGTMPGMAMFGVLQATASPVGGSPMPMASGGMMGGSAPVDLLELQVAGDPTTAPALPATLRAIAPLDPTGAPQRTVAMTEDHANLDFRLNGQKFDPNRVDFQARLDTTEVWTIDNQGGMDHPFHLHGFQFQVLDRNGTPDAYRAWKDTVNVPAKEQVRFAVRFTDFPGKRVFHCHILDHEDLGMMGVLDVE